ncbi:uncharacterized protein [Choristoneura fumiferana]|uniref:uncharacterized protein n=1 Tax=Choristoneura fumiferana TaxID=7141 RepID=UPI003D1545F4
MSNMVKCKSCNVVINELLAFISNKIHLLDEQSLRRICVTAFSESDIVTAKRLLFESVSRSSELKKRKCDGKSNRDLDDVIGLMKDCRVDEIPIFVARDLHKLPPVLFNHLDATKVLKDLAELRMIVNEFATKNELDAVKSDLENLKKSSLVNNYQENINFKRGACLVDSFNCHSGPMGMPFISKESEVSPHIEKTSKYVNLNECDQRGDSPYKAGTRAICDAQTVEVPTSADSECAGAGEGRAPQVPPAVADTGMTPEPVRAITIGPGHTGASSGEKQKRVSYSDTARGDTFKSPVLKDEWVKVQRKRLKNRFMGHQGKAIVSSDTKFRAADIRVPLYIYNVSKEVSVCDIVGYIKSKSNITVTLDKVTMKMEKDYDAYKVFVPKLKIGIFLKDDFWPDGIAYRRFVNFKKN